MGTAASHLEKVNRATLHAAAVVLNDGRAVVLCGRTGMGKSTLAASMFKAGAGVLADDAVEILSGPGGFEACSTDKFLDVDTEFPGSSVIAIADTRRADSHQSPVPVSEIAILHRVVQAPPVRIRYLSAGEAFIQLYAHMPPPADESENIKAVIMAMSFTADIPVLELFFADGHTRLEEVASVLVQSRV